MTTFSSVGAIPESPANGGTGVANNAASTITVSGNFGTTFTVSGTTSVTLPTSGTLSTTTGTVTSVAGAGLITGGTITATGTHTVTAAVQSDMEAATSTTTAVTPAVVQNHPGIVKAWGQSNATLSAITASYNMGSVTDGGTGVITWNYTTAFSGAAVSGGNATVLANDGVAYSVQLATIAASSSVTYLRNSLTAALADPAGGLMFAAYGDQ